MAPAACSSEVADTVAVIVTAVLLPILALLRALVSPLPVKVTEGLLENVTAFVKLCLVAVSAIELGLWIVPELFALNILESASSITSYRLLGITVVAFAEPWNPEYKVFTLLFPPVVVVNVLPCLIQ